MFLDLAITSFSAALFLPFVLPICLWVMWSDLNAMKIPNSAVLALAGVFVVVGLIAVPIWPDYPMRLAALGIMLVAGIIINSAGLMGAGDAKFIAAAAPFVAPGDVIPLIFIFTANLLAAFVTHRIAKYTPLRAMAPHWESWERGKKFPMGFALGATLLIYLGAGAAFGA
ncbi:MAG: prepilin peptidase [Pseudomonadota bacterium]